MTLLRSAGMEHLATKWQGERGRLEVWYATFTDAATGDGYWIHHELVATTSGPVVQHGWVAAFPAERAPRCERFTWDERFEVTPGRLCGRTDHVSWDLSYTDGGPPMYTFPRIAWERGLLPGQQIVPAPEATFHGTVTIDGAASTVEGPGALARIYGHGNAERWIWLHAPLGAGEVLEIVGATSRRPLLRRLPMLGFVQLRLQGDDWPANPLTAASRFRAESDGHAFTVRGSWGSRRLRAAVRLDPARSVTLRYEDPDGEPAWCTNSERADAEVVLERRDDDWHVERRWRLDGTAHAEIGRRAQPPSAL